MLPYNDIVHDLKGTEADAYVQATATQTGDEVALKGGAVLVVVHVHAAATADADNYFTFTVNQATATGGSFSAAASTQYVTHLWDRVINATTETGVWIFQFIPVATYDYIKVIATETSTADITYSVSVIQSDVHLPTSA